MPLIKFKRLNEQFQLPTQATPGAAGFDVRYTGTDPYFLKAGCTRLVRLGFKVEIPEGYEIQVRPRSGLALKHSITVTNAPGTIDSDYRGECGVILTNLSEFDYTITPGERIAQFVVQQVPEVTLVEVEELSETTRGEGGYGSTGKQ